LIYFNRKYFNKNQFYFIFLRRFRFCFNI